jgi:hypothetical protein
MLPKSKVLNTSKSFVAQTKVASKMQKQSQTVTINVSPNERKCVEIENEKTSSLGETREAHEAGYENLELPNSVDEYKQILEHKDRQVQALNIIIEIIKSNPLIVNKYIIANYQYMNELIKLLTNSSEVEFVEKDVDAGCVCNCDNVVMVDKIFVRKNGEVYNLKYSFPDVIQILESHRISIKIVSY